jgi:hypothetical protein
MHKKMMMIRNGLMVTITLLVVLGLVGATIDIIPAIPDDAPVFLNGETKTFIAKPCIDALHTVALFGGHPGTYAEAVRLNYLADNTCLAAGTLMGTRLSLTTLILVKLGVLQKQREWWD